MRFDRKTFFDRFRHQIDPTVSQEQVDGLELLLGKMEQDKFWAHIPQIAYALATVYHETAGSFQPVEEGYYLGSRSKVKAFQKTLRYAPYFGRGYVQLTWKKNYERAEQAFGHNLVDKPDNALDPEVAYLVMTYGMHQGWFTGKKLDDYIKGEKKDYADARRVINGTDKAGLIAGYARSFEKILSESSSAVDTSGNDPSEDTAGQQKSADETAKTEVRPPVRSVVEVQQLQPETPPPSSENKVDKAINTWSARWAAIPATITSGVFTFFAWLKDSPTNLVIAGIVTTGAIVGLYFVTRMIVNAIKDARKDKLAERERERVHELQVLAARSAASPDLNTIRFVPPPTTVPAGTGE